MRRLLLGDGGSHGLEDGLQLDLDVISQGLDLRPQLSELLGGGASYLGVGLLHLLLVLFHVGHSHILQALQTLRELSTHRLHNGHQGSLGLLHVGGDLAAQLLQDGLHLGPQGVHLGGVLGGVLGHDGLQPLAVVFDVPVDNLLQSSTLGLEVGLQGIEVGLDGGTQLSGGARDGAEDVVGDGADRALQGLDLSVGIFQALRNSVPRR